VQREIDELTSHPNLPGAVGFGVLAAAAGAVTLFAVARLAVAPGGGVGWVVIETLAIGSGWLVGKAVVLGSGNKRGPSLQLTAGTLSSIPLLGCRYLLINYLWAKQMAGSFTGWLTPSKFLALYGRLLVHGAVIVDFPFLALAIACGVTVPLADRLVSELPRWAHRRA
jgi:hypothetical protein